MNKNTILKSSIIIIAFTLLGKILAFVRDALIAGKFGASYNTGVYMFSIGIVYLLSSVSYGLTTTFIPIYSEVIESYDEKRRCTFVNNIITVSTIFTLIATLLLMLGSSLIVRIFAPGFASIPNVFSMAVKMTSIILMSLVFLSMQSVITGVLQAHQQFKAPAAMATCANIIYIIYLVFFAPYFGILGFGFATVLGFLVQLLINIPTYRRFGYRYSIVINLKDPLLLKLVRLMIPVIVSTSVAQLGLVVSRFFATSLGEQAVPALDFSNKINSLIYEVFAVAISMAVYPALSTFVSTKDTKGYSKTLHSSIISLLLIMIPCAFAVAVLRIPIISLIFKRGAFSEEAVLLTSGALLFYAPSMIAYGLRDVLNKAFYALKDTKTPLINSVIGIILNIIFSLLLVNKLGVSGLTLSTTLSMFILTTTLFMKLKSRLTQFETKAFTYSVIKIVISSAIMAVVVRYISLFLSKIMTNNNTTNAVILLSALIFGTLCYSICLIVLKIPEFYSIVRMLFSKLKIRSNKF